MARSQSNGRGGAGKATPPDPEPGDLAREAAAEWKLAVQYAAAAVKPAFGRAAGALKDRAVERWSDRTSLKDRLTTSGTDKGGRIGDAADALLAKAGAPGKLAAKAGVGSRVVERMRANGDGEAPEPEAEAEPEGAEDEVPEAESEPEDPEPVKGPETDEEPEAESEADDEPEAAGEPDDDVEAEPEPDEEQATEAEEPAEKGPVGESAEGEEEAAASDWLEHDNAYSEEVEQYEHHDAYEMSNR